MEAVSAENSAALIKSLICISKAGDEFMVADAPVNRNFVGDGGIACPFAAFTASQHDE
jgi:hypothetical protein